MLIGAVVAALLVLPAVAADNGWTVWPTKTFNAQSLHIEDVVGSVRVNVQPGPMKVDVSGNPAFVNNVEVTTEGGTLHIDGNSDQPSGVSVWDWKKWFDYSHVGDNQRDAKLYIKVTVPRGTPVKVEDMIGGVTIGDTYGPVDLETTAADATVGRVTGARVSLSGSGTIAIADVLGDLNLEIAGSGKVTSGHANNVKAEIAGSGNAILGTITGNLDIDIAGSGDFTAQRTRGSVKVDIAGSGNVKIADGVADPLQVDIMGAGDLNFGGVAVNPRISAIGSGTVRIRTYKGNLSNDGMASVQIGGDIPVPPSPPSPHAPPSPPAPPAPNMHPVPPAPPAPPHHSDDDDDDN
jgi:hypothetical protein